MALAAAPQRALDVLNHEGVRRWTSIVTLGLAALALVYVGVTVVSGVLQPSAARCGNPPARVTSIPQLIEVLLCAASFVLGRLTARPKVRTREELRRRMRRGDLDDQAPEDRVRTAIWLQGGLTAALLLITLLLAFETVTLALTVWPITFYLRCAAEAAPWRTVIAASAFCFLAGRWLWLPEPPEEEAS